LPTDCLTDLFPLLRSLPQFAASGCNLPVVRDQVPVVPFLPILVPRFHRLSSWGDPMRLTERLTPSIH